MIMGVWQGTCRNAITQHYDYSECSHEHHFRLLFVGLVVAIVAPTQPGPEPRRLSEHSRGAAGDC